MLTPTSSALIMIGAGFGIPILAALNAGLGTRVGSPVTAALILFAVALAVVGVVWLVLGGPLAPAKTAPRHLFLAGLFVVIYVLSVTWVAPSFGVGNAVFFVLLGQLLSAALIDHFGLFGARVTEMSLTRMAGIAVMGGGIYLTQIAGR